MRKTAEGKEVMISRLASPRRSVNCDLRQSECPTHLSRLGPFNPTHITHDTSNHTFGFMARYSGLRLWPLKRSVYFDVWANPFSASTFRDICQTQWACDRG